MVASAATGLMCLHTAWSIAKMLVGIAAIQPKLPGCWANSEPHSAGICNPWGSYKTSFSSNKPIQEVKCSYETITQVLEELKRVPDMCQRKGMTTRDIRIAGQANKWQMPAHADHILAQG